MFKQLLLLSLCLLLCSIIFAQTKYNIRLGISGALAAKLSFLDQDGKKTEHYNPYGAAQIVGAIYIEDQDPASLSLLLKIGFGYDNDNYLVNNNAGLRVATDQLNIIVNPEILFPLSNEKMKIGAGIGMEYMFDKRLWLNGISGTDIDNAYYYGNLENKERNIVPFINTNFWYLYKSNIWFGFGIKQPLLSSYYKNETMYFGSTSFDLRHQPTYFNAAVVYQF